MHRPLSASRQSIRKASKKFFKLRLTNVQGVWLRTASNLSPSDIFTWTNSASQSTQNYQSSFGQGSKVVHLLECRRCSYPEADRGKTPLQSYIFAYRKGSSCSFQRVRIAMSFGLCACFGREAPRAGTRRASPSRHRIWSRTPRNPGTGQCCCEGEDLS